MPWTIPARPVVGNTSWNATQEAIWTSLKSFVDGLEVADTTASSREALTSTVSRPLFAFFAALAARNCDILVIGDSKSAGQGASVLSNRWTDVLRDNYRAQFGITGGYGYIPAWSSGGTQEFPWVFGGTFTNSQQETGLGRHQATLSTSGTATITVDCSSFKLFFGRKNTSSDAVTIAIDGGSATAYSIPGTAGGPTTSGAVWTSPALTPGSHTIVVTRTGGSVLFEGGFFYDGDETTGIRTWNGAHSGYYAQYFVDSDGHAAKWQGMLTEIDPDLTIIAFGTNEWRTSPGRTVAQFKTDLQGLISAVRTKSTAGSFLLVMYEEPITGVANASTYAEYVDAAYEVAAEDTGGPGAGTGVAILDLSRRMPKAENPDPYSLHTDGIHLNDAGNLIVSDAALGFITPR
jgi:lysophospholipase L1-like esterase